MLDSLGQVLPHAARAFGDRTALVIDGRSFSFRELDELSDCAGGEPRRMGIRPGDRVTLYAPNSWEWIVSYYGALKTGAVINPINVMLTPAEVAYVTKDCGASALIGSPDKVKPALESGVTGLTAIVFGDQPVAGATSFNELIAKRQDIRTGRGQARGAVDHRLHVRHDRPSEGRDAVAPRRHPQRRHDRADAR